MAEPDDDMVEFTAITEDEDEEGPECGTAEAATYFLVCYADHERIRFIERNCCCFRHVPHPTEVLPEDAQLLEVVIEDARVKTVVRDGGTEITFNDETIFIPAHL
jgi:hypothetical protein